MFMISRITSLENYLRKTNTCGHHPFKSFRSLEFLTPDTNDAPPATSLSPKIFWPSAAPSERVPVRILTSDLLHRTLGFEAPLRFISATHGRPLSLPFFVSDIFTVDLMVGQNSQMYDYSCCCCCYQFLSLSTSTLFVRDDVSTRIALVFVRSKWTKWNQPDLQKCAGAEGEELVLSWPSKREPVRCCCCYHHFFNIVIMVSTQFISIFNNDKK